MVFSDILSDKGFLVLKTFIFGAFLICYDIVTESGVLRFLSVLVTAPGIYVIFPAIRKSN